MTGSEGEITVRPMTLEDLDAIFFIDHEIRRKGQAITYENLTTERMFAIDRHVGRLAKPVSYVDLIRGDVSIALWVVKAPIFKLSLPSRIYSSSCRFLILIRYSGAKSLCLSNTTRLCPPAIILALSLYLESKEHASFRLAGSKYSKRFKNPPPHFYKGCVCTFITFVILKLKRLTCQVFYYL